MRWLTLQSALDHAMRDRLPPTPSEAVDLAAARVLAIAQAHQLAADHPASATAVLHQRLAEAVNEFDGARIAAAAYYSD